MSTHVATIQWHRSTDDFVYDTYNREHTWHFPNGQTIDASSAPDYLGNAACVDPEEAFVASLSSCHMLTFLAIAARKRYVVDQYTDDAAGYLEKNAAGMLAVTRVELRPRIEFSGVRKPDRAGVAAMHEKAHKHCFIANSVTTEVVVVPATDSSEV
jgi:organic hydroperoxide reductase OsmC/OhrA